MSWYWFAIIALMVVGAAVLLFLYHFQRNRFPRLRIIWRRLGRRNRQPGVTPRRRQRRTAAQWGKLIVSLIALAIIVVSLATAIDNGTSGIPEWLWNLCSHLFWIAVGVGGGVLVHWGLTKLGKSGWWYCLAATPPVFILLWYVWGFINPGSIDGEGLFTQAWRFISKHWLILLLLGVGGASSFFSPKQAGKIVLILGSGTLALLAIPFFGYMTLHDSSLGASIKWLSANNASILTAFLVASALTMLSKPYRSTVSSIAGGTLLLIAALIFVLNGLSPTLKAIDLAFKKHLDWEIGASNLLTTSDRNRLARGEEVKFTREKTGGVWFTPPKAPGNQITRFSVKGPCVKTRFDDEPITDLCENTQIPVVKRAGRRSYKIDDPTSLVIIIWTDT